MKRRWWISWPCLGRAFLTLNLSGEGRVDLLSFSSTTVTRRAGLCLVYLLLSNGYQRGSWHTDTPHSPSASSKHRPSEEESISTVRILILLYLFDLLYWSEVEDKVADILLLLADRVNSKTLKFDRSSLQSANRDVQVRFYQHTLIQDGAAVTEGQFK